MIGAREICISLFEDAGLEWQFTPSFDGWPQDGKKRGAIRSTNGINSLGISWYLYLRDGDPCVELNCYWFSKAKDHGSIMQGQKIIRNIIDDPKFVNKINRVIKAYAQWKFFSECIYKVAGNPGRFMTDMIAQFELPKWLTKDK